MCIDTKVQARAIRAVDYSSDIADYCAVEEIIIRSGARSNTAAQELRDSVASGVEI